MGSGPFQRVGRGRSPAVYFMWPNCAF